MKKYRKRGLALIIILCMLLTGTYPVLAGESEDVKPENRISADEEGSVADPDIAEKAGSVVEPDVTEKAGSVAEPDITEKAGSVAEPDISEEPETVLSEEIPESQEPSDLQLIPEAPASEERILDYDPTAVPKFHVQTADVQGNNATTISTGPNYKHTPTTYYFDIGKGDYPVPYSGNGYSLNYSNYPQCMGILFPGDKVVFIPAETGAEKGYQGVPGYYFSDENGVEIELEEGDKIGPILITSTATKGDWPNATHTYVTGIEVVDAPIMLSNASGCGFNSSWSHYGHDENNNPLQTWGMATIRYIELPKYHPIEYHYRYFDEETWQWMEIPEADMANAVYYKNKPANPEVIWAEDLSVNFVPYETGMSYSQWPDYRAGAEFTFSRPFIEGYYYDDMEIGQYGDNFVRWDPVNNHDQQSYTCRFRSPGEMNFTWTFTNKKEGSELDPIVVNINYYKGSDRPATVTLDANGGTINGRSEWMYNNYAVHSNDDFNPAEYIPVREGYVFDGWYKDAACTEVVAPALDNGTDQDGYRYYDGYSMRSYIVSYGNKLFRDNGAQHFRVYAKWSKEGAKALKDLDISGIETKTFTGSPITQSPVIKDGDKTLVEGTDFRTFGYENNVNYTSGGAKMRIQGLGDYKGIVYKTFSIDRKPVTINFDLEYTQTEYDGTSKTPAIKNFTCSEPGLAYNNTNFSTSYYNNSSASTETNKARVSVSARGNYAVNNNGSTSLTKEFTITPRAITPTVILSYTSATYTGGRIYPGVTVKDGDKVIPSNNYTVDVVNNIEPGTATDIVTLKNNYSGTGMATFTIVPASKTLDVSIDETDYTPDRRVYSTWEKQPDVIVKSGGKTLEKSTDYTVSYENNINAGTAYVSVTGINSYAGCTGMATFTIEPFDLGTSGLSLDGRVTAQRYTGQPVEPKPYFSSIYISGLYYVSLMEGVDYTASYSNNINVGTANFTMTGKGNYKGSISTTFQIEKRDTEIIDLSKAAAVGEIKPCSYSGSPIYVTPTVSVDGRTLKNGDDYVLSYENNTEIGTATVIITGVNNYKGTVRKNFEIIDSSSTPTDKKLQTITASDVNKTYEGKTFSFSLGAKTNGDGKLSYISDNTAVAAVGSDGTVTVKGAGTAKITINASSTEKYYPASKIITVTVKKADAPKPVVKQDQSVSVNIPASVAAGKTAAITVTGAKGSLSYKSADDSVAAVAQDGKVTAKKVGTVNITVTSAATAAYNARSVTVTLKVVPAATSSVNAENLATGIKVTWKKVTGAAGYNIYRNGKKIKTIAKAGTLTYTDKKGNTNGTKYVYKVEAYAGSGTSTLSKSVTVYRVARPKTPSASNISSKTMQVKWAKNAKGSGYQIQYSTVKSFAKGSKTVTVKGSGKVSSKIGKLKKGKTYYVRVRTFKTVGGKKYYSAWSTAKSVKIKK